MALNEYEFDSAMHRAEGVDFPAVVVFDTNSGVSHWESEVVLDIVALRNYLQSDECPDWKGSGLSLAYYYVLVENGFEYLEKQLAPSYRDCATDLYELMEYEEMPHYEFDAWMDMQGYEWTADGWIPCDDEDEDE